MQTDLSSTLRSNQVRSAGNNGKEGRYVPTEELLFNEVAERILSGDAFPDRSQTLHERLSKDQIGRLVFEAALREFQQRENACYESRVPVDEKHGTAIVRPVIVFDPEGTGELNRLADKLRSGAENALLVFDPERMLSGEIDAARSLVLHGRHPILSIGVQDIYSPERLDAERLSQLGMELSKQSEENSPFFSVEQVSSLIDARGALRAKDSLLQLDDFGGAPNLAKDLIANQRPRWGRTQFQAAFKLDLEVGEFRAYAFLDVATNAYTIALVSGDLDKSDTIKLRMHSSCVTSETESACDCDCVEQLAGALTRIAESEAGILFYLVQEGRGAGLASKAQDRSLVQATGDQFAGHGGPYHAQGLPTDHRSYAMVGDILQLFGVANGSSKNLVLLTNNKTKRDALTKMGLGEVGIERIEGQPNPYNIGYLTEKGKADFHELNHPALELLRKALAPQPAIPAMSTALADEPRLSHMASYRLPIRPFSNESVLDPHEWDAIQSDPDLRTILQERKLISQLIDLSGGRKRITLDPSAFENFQNEIQKTDPNHPLPLLLTQPIWMAKDVYHDLVTNNSYIHLRYGESRNAPDGCPLVRLHFDSLLGRIPMVKDVQDRNRTAFKMAVREIVDHGFGSLVVMPDDARGAGLGAQAYSLMAHQLGLNKSRTEVYEQLGIDTDERAYDAAMRVLKHHHPQGRVHPIVQSPDWLGRRKWFEDLLDRNGLQVQSYINLFPH